jgi:hypothetical protein
MPTGTEDFMMRSRTLLGVGLGWMLLGGAPAVAGAKGTIAVDVHNSAAGGYGSGVMSDARSSSDNMQRITIGIYSSTTLAEYAEVTFIDKFGTVGRCQTDNPVLLTALKAVRSDAFIFVRWDASNRCTDVGVDHSSAFAPKTP